MSASPLAAVAPAPAQSPGPRAEPARAEGGFAQLLQGQDAVAASSGNAGGQAGAHAPGQAPGETRPDPAGSPQDPADATAAAGAAGEAEAATDEDPADPAEADWPPPGLAWLLQAPGPEPVPVRSQPGGLASADGTLAGNLPRLPGLMAVGAGAADAAALAEAMPAAAAAAAAQDVDALADSALARLQPPPADAPDAPAFVLPPAPATGAPAALPAAAAASAPHLPTPHLQDAGFAEDVGEHIQWMAGQKISHALIRITPHDLGPVEVRLQLDGDRLSADFSSAQAEVRQALEQGLSRLREMLGQHGFELAHAGVGHQHGEGREGTRGAPQDRMGTGEADPGEPATAPIQRRLGLLDAYA